MFKTHIRCFCWRSFATNVCLASLPHVVSHVTCCYLCPPSEASPRPRPVWLPPPAQLAAGLPAGWRHRPPRLFRNTTMEGPLPRTSGLLPSRICPASVPLTTRDTLDNHSIASKTDGVLGNQHISHELLSELLVHPKRCHNLTSEWKEMGHVGIHWYLSKTLWTLGVQSIIQMP